MSKLETTEAHSLSSTQNSRGHNEEHLNSPEGELVHRLKLAIDDRGRYDYRLNDMSAGYAAGKGIASHAARREIEDHFKNHFGKTPHQYLEDRFSERRNSREDTGARRNTERSRGDDYER